MPFKLSGVAAMTSKLRAISAKFPDDVAAALYQIGNEEMTESKRRVPVDTGTLRASGHVREPVRSGNAISVSLVYGGAAEQYAVVVHEDLDAYHAHGQAKYLESVLKESAPHMKARVAKRINLNEIARRA